MPRRPRTLPLTAPPGGYAAHPRERSRLAATSSLHIHRGTAPPQRQVEGGEWSGSTCPVPVSGPAIHATESNPRRRPYGPARICCVPVLISLGRQFESRLPRHCCSKNVCQEYEEPCCMKRGKMQRSGAHFFVHVPPKAVFPLSMLADAASSPVERM